jgi:hypothetical protein
VPQADALATRLAAVVEGLPGAPRGLQSDEDVPTSLVDALGLEGRCTTLAPLAGGRHCKVAAADACLGPKPGVVLGLAHRHAHQESVRLLYGRCTRGGMSSLRWQSQGPSLLL